MIRIGPAGWSYKDWNGVVYPKPRPKGFREIHYLARYFDVLEINSSFYRPMPASFARRWMEQVDSYPNFRFTAKLWRKFTHERNAKAEDIPAMQSGLRLLLEGGRLGALLAQFPLSFHNTPENRKYISQLRGFFSEYPLVTEFRHDSWTEPGVFDLLAEWGVGFCNVDQPLFEGSIAPSAVTTSAIGYVRLHGRNYQQWFGKNRSGADRYNYLYSVDEVAEWANRVTVIAERASEVYVVANNCYEGKALVNCLELSSVLTGKPVEAPPPLLAHYQELRRFAAAEL